MGDLAGGLLPDFRSRRAVMDLRVHGVVVLIGEDRVGMGGGDGAALHDVVLGVIGRHRRRRDDDLGPEGAQQAGFLLRHLVRHREDAAVALHRGREREPHARVPRRRFDDQPAGPEPTLTLRRLDHGEADAVLHRAPRVEELRLGVERRADSLRQLVEADQRRPADRLEDVSVRLSVRRHRYPLSPCSCLVARRSYHAAPRWCRAARRRCPVERGGESGET